ncbi:MAG TPA: protein kinase [Polyangiaceae bacterium]|nr:protein kinase [Polyangiaceae bacterium]
MTMLLGAVRAGDVLARKYRVERILGAGGMGVVVAATHELLRERVAVKLLSPERTLDKSFVRRFLSEARATVKLRSEHVARVFDVGTLDDGTPFIVMEYLEGEDLACHLHERGPIAPPQAVDYVLQACAGLAEAHGLGIVHRDLKPANLFLSARPDGSALVKVLDFGLAKRADDSIEATKSGQLVGSPNYMAPEQVSAPSGVDARVDVWALGVILYEFLSGSRPFAGVTVSEIFAQILHGTPPPLRARVPSLSPALEAVVARCLERDRDRRFDGVDALRAALGRCVGAAAAPPAFASSPTASSYRPSRPPASESTLLLTRAHDAPSPSDAFATTHLAAPPRQSLPPSAPGAHRHSPSSPGAHGHSPSAPGAYGRSPSAPGAYGHPPSAPRTHAHSPSAPGPAPPSHGQAPPSHGHAPHAHEHAPHAHAPSAPAPSPHAHAFSVTASRARSLDPPTSPSAPPRSTEAWANSSQVLRANGWVWPLRAALIMAALAFSTLVALRSRHLVASAKRDVPSPALGTPADPRAPGARSPAAPLPSAAPPAAPKPAPSAAPRASAIASGPPAPGAAPPTISASVTITSPALPPSAGQASRPSPGRPAAVAPPSKPPSPPRSAAGGRRGPEPSAPKPHDEKSDLLSERTW